MTQQYSRNAAITIRNTTVVDTKEFNVIKINPFSLALSAVVVAAQVKINRLAIELFTAIIVAAILVFLITAMALLKGKGIHASTMKMQMN